MGKRLIALARIALRRFVRNERGASATEFAVLLPVMLFLYFGGWGVSQALSLNRLVALTSGTVTNLVSQYTTISATSQMPDILAASTQVLSPFPATPARVVISQIAIDANGNATIDWSQANTGAARTVGSSVTLPAALDTPGSWVIWGETTYAYTPGVAYPNLGTINLYSSIYMLPRASSRIILAQ
jgi:Flp pilus assembly protein TadG